VTLHVRLVSPPNLTGRLLDGLTATEGVRNLVVLPRAARRPAGDAIQFDLLAGSANGVFRQLRGLELDRRGSVSIEQVDAELTDGATAGRAGAIGSLRREVTPVWEMVDAAIRRGATYPPSFFILLAMAGLIGSVGIFTNSQILIVGAMVVGPEYDAIIAVALGLSARDWRAAREGLLALTLGFLLAIVITFLFGLVIRGTGRAPDAFLRGLTPVAAFISSPNIFSVIVAVLAGLVGVVSLTEVRANALIGVFISVTTIPAAANLGVSVAFSRWPQAQGSLLQLLNVVLLTGVGAFGLTAQRAIWRRLGGRVSRGRRPGAGPTVRRPRDRG
jgi:uncharacterized hydrophobic protein (TIGR00271 family)